MICILKNVLNNNWPSINSLRVISDFSIKKIVIKSNFFFSFVQEKTLFSDLQTHANKPNTTNS